jgi:regulator of replication initiation timing
LKKKLQVFVSSTYEDLKEERQYAVQAILTSGHIPAGMELFSAGDESQKETIKKWIEESDVYLLILGGRYGSIDLTTGKSYTHWEYEYAGELGKPRFAVVISEVTLEKKVMSHGTAVMEKENQTLYKEFRKEVLSKLCKIYDDYRDIQLAIFHKMGEYSSREDLIGWIHGNEVPNTTELINENSRLRIENTSLNQEIKHHMVQLEDLLKRKVNVRNFEGQSYEDLKHALSNIMVKLSKAFGESSGTEHSCFKLFIAFKDSFATGLTNQYSMSEQSQFLFFSLAPKLMTFNLIEKVKVTGTKYEKIQTSKLGFEFLKFYELDKLKASTKVNSTTKTISKETDEEEKPSSEIAETKKRTPIKRKTTG